MPVKRVIQGKPEEKRINELMKSIGPKPPEPKKGLPEIFKEFRKALVQPGIDKAGTALERMITEGHLKTAEERHLNWVTPYLVSAAVEKEGLTHRSIDALKQISERGQHRAIGDAIADKLSSLKVTPEEPENLVLRGLPREEVEKLETRAKNERDRKIRNTLQVLHELVKDKNIDAHELLTNRLLEEITDIENFETMKLSKETQELLGDIHTTLLTKEENGLSPSKKEEVKARLAMYLLEKEKAEKERK